MIKSYKDIFSAEQIQQAQKLLDSLNAEQKAWLSGYISGLQQDSGFLNLEASETKESENKPVSLSILYGSHTGNSKLIADGAVQLAQSQGIEAKLLNMQDYKSRQFKDETNVLVVVSTHGEGDPPVAAEDFYEYLFGKKAADCSGKNIAVIALGDSSYTYFCKTGNDIYHQLLKLGAHSVYDLLELDVDFQDEVSTHLPKIIEQFALLGGVSEVSEKEAKTLVTFQSEWTEAEVLNKVQLNGRGSEKETYHIELDIEGSGISYQPGDALEVTSVNKRNLVRDILEKLQIDEAEAVTVGETTKAISESLLADYELTVVTLPVIKKYAELAKSEALDSLINDANSLNDYLYQSDFLDLITDFPVALNTEQLIGILRKLSPRLYSISSSYALNPDEVHITVGAVRYEVKGRKRDGVCSGYLADDVHEGDTVLIRVKANQSFKLPQEDAAVIMVGPGTGIAPFRSFLQEREAQSSVAKNWLFFGDQHFETDFLYQAELLKYRAEGIISELDVAFSRDQSEKVYVQHRMEEKGEELYKWLSEGAHFYICGDMKRMAKDVKSTLVSIVQKYGNLNAEEAEAYVKQLRSAGRLQEDVY